VIGGSRLRDEWLTLAGAAVAVAALVCAVVYLLFTVLVRAVYAPLRVAPA
jgi:hypothetical protein